MDAFESLVAMILEREGYWVKSSYKVELTKEEKRYIGRPSSPRWELDLIAYKGSDNELLIVECKSFLDSPGVRFRGFDGSSQSDAARYKLFNEARLRETVFRRLAAQLQDLGACAESPAAHLCLAAGKIATEDDRLKLKEHFAERGWKLFDDDWLREKLLRVSSSGYENQVAAIVAKLLLNDDCG
jgi:hypothetical protein